MMNEGGSKVNQLIYTEFSEINKKKLIFGGYFNNLARAHTKYEK